MPVFTGLRGGPAQSTSNRQLIDAQLEAGGADTYEFPKGSFYVDAGGGWMPDHGTRIFGQGEGATKVTVRGSGNLFNTNGKGRCHFAGFTVQGYGNHTGGAVFLDQGDATQEGVPNQANGSKITDITMEACWDGIYHRDVNSTFVERVHMIAMWGYVGILAEALNTLNRIDLLRVRGVTYSANPNQALANNRGTAMVIDGAVHTINLVDFNVTRPYQGLVVRNTTGLPYGQHADFLEATNFRVDFPVQQGIIMDSIGHAFFNQLYCHGSKYADGIVASPSVRQLKISQSKITGAALCNIYTDANDTELQGNDYSHANQANQERPCIMFGPNSWTGRVIGGVAKEGNQVYGIARHNPGSDLQRVATNQIFGSRGEYWTV